MLAERFIVIKRDGVLIRLEQGEDSHDVGHVECHNARRGPCVLFFFEDLRTHHSPAWLAITGR